jgi:hypothetical protein
MGVSNLPEAALPNAALLTLAYLDVASGYMHVMS